MNAVGQANPFSDASEFNMLDFIIARATDEMQTVSVGEVIAVNTGAQTVDVQILVNLATGGNTPVEHEVIANRPYYRMQGGGNAIICDPVVGDIGVVVFASRDITGVVAAKGAANPSSNRRFSWSDGIYFGGILNGAPTQYMQFLAAGGGINIVSPGTVAIQAPATTASGTLNVTGNTTLQATLAVTGTSTLTGGVSAPGGITVGAPTGGAAAPGTINATGLFVNGVAVSTGGGGGGGTVTSVGISTPGVGVVVGGGPVTTAGTLTVDLSSTAYAVLALAVTALQSISIATGTGLTGGPLAASGSTVALSAATIASLLPASPAQGDIVYYNGSAWVNLAPGTAGQVLQTGGTSANPSWINSGGITPGIPGTIPNLVMWWSSDNILISSGNAINRLQEKTPWVTGILGASSGAGTPTIDANTLNSLPIVKYPAASPTPYVIGTPLTLSTAITAFVVVKPNAAVTAAAMAIFGSNGNGGLAFYFNSAASVAKVGLTKTGIAVIGSSTATWASGTAFQANVTYLASSGAYSFRQASAAAGSGTGATAAGTTPITWFGADQTVGSAQLLNHSIAEIIIYESVLTLTQIQAVEAYLLAKWGV